MADLITLTAGTVVYHDGCAYRLMHATQVEPYRAGGGITTPAPSLPTPKQPLLGVAAISIPIPA